MGFFDNLFKKEARKIISSVVDEVVDNVVDNIRDRDGKDVTVRQETTSGNYSAPAQTSADISPDEDCACEVAEVEARIRAVVNANWGNSIEIRENIPSSELSAEEGAVDYNFGFYHNGSLIAVANILDYGTDYWHKRVRLAKEACARQNVGYVHFIMRLPNRKSYIDEQLKKIIRL